MCSANDACAAFAFNAAKQICRFKDSCDDWRPNDGRIAGAALGGLICMSLRDLFLRGGEGRGREGTGGRGEGRGDGTGGRGEERRGEGRGGDGTGGRGEGRRGEERRGEERGGEGRGEERRGEERRGEGGGCRTTSRSRLITQRLSFASLSSSPGVKVIQRRNSDKPGLIVPVQGDEVRADERREVPTVADSPAPSLINEQPPISEAPSYEQPEYDVKDRIGCSGASINVRTCTAPIPSAETPQSGPTHERLICSWKGPSPESTRSRFAEIRRKGCSRVRTAMQRGVRMRSLHVQLEERALLPQGRLPPPAEP